MMLNIPFLKLFRVFSLYSSLFFISIGLISCGEEKKEPVPTSNKIIIKQEFKDKVATKKSSDEYLLLENTCLYCHTIGTPKEIEVAPPMQVVRDIYKQTYPVKEEFIKSFTEFCGKPDAEKSLMKSAIDQYGLIDDLGHTKEDVEEIAAYLFDYQF